jgi:hypothetical protein
MVYSALVQRRRDTTEIHINKHAEDLRVDRIPSKMATASAISDSPQDPLSMFP